MNDGTNIIPAKTKPHLRTKRTVSTEDAAHHAFLKLPFIADRGKNGLPVADVEKGELPRCFWHVVSTDDFWRDQIGRAHV